MISSVRLGGTTACMTIEGRPTPRSSKPYVRDVLVLSLRPG
jgi:hypothetical protein